MLLPFLENCKLRLRRLIAKELVYLLDSFLPLFFNPTPIIEVSVQVETVLEKAYQFFIFGLL